MQLQLAGVFTCKQLQKDCEFKELNKNSVVAKYATAQFEGKRRIERKLIIDK